jgi:hypothetical protein
MKFHSMVWIAFGLILIFTAALTDQQPALAQSAETSCITCHETQAENPVRTDGQWHIQHNTLACEICHAGSPTAETQEAAHAGQMVNPMEAGTSCAICHPGTSQELIATYLVLITPEASSSAEATLTPQDEDCQVIVTVCAETTDAVTTPAMTISATLTTIPSSTLTPVLVGAGSEPADGASGGASGFSWLKALQFTRGPLFKTAFWFFVVGMLLRLVQALRSGWKHRSAADKTGRAAGAGKSFLTGLLVLPFIPGLKGAFQRKPVIYLAGGLFHLGLLAVILFSKTHMSALKSMIGFGWPVLPAVSVDWLAAIGIVAMLALLINRLVDPVLRLISGPAEWLNWLMVFLPMITGFVLARKLWLPYEVSFSIHMLLVDILLIWIPLSRISHFVFYFFSRTIHGIEFNTRRVAAP